MRLQETPSSKGHPGQPFGCKGTTCDTYPMAGLGGACAPFPCESWRRRSAQSVNQAQELKVHGPETPYLGHMYSFLRVSNPKDLFSPCHKYCNERRVRI